LLKGYEFPVVVQFEFPQIAKMPDPVPELGMTTQHTNQQQPSRPREDHKVQKLIERIETKLALQAKAIREAKRGNSKN